MAYKFWNYARRVDANTVGIYAPDGIQALVIDDATANTTSIRGLSATTKILKIYANATDTNPNLTISGTQGIVLNATSTKNIGCSYGGVSQFTIGYTDPDVILTAVTANKNLSLVTSGTGVVKFGTYTGSGDVACNGSIAILDSAGNARKLMTTA